VRALQLCPIGALAVQRVRYRVAAGGHAGPATPEGLSKVAMRFGRIACALARYGELMPKTVQIRDLDDEVYAGLVRRAAETGVSVPELLRAEAARLAARPSVEAWLSRTRQRSAPLGRVEVVAALDEQRGSWPDAGR